MYAAGNRPRQLNAVGTLDLPRVGPKPIRGRESMPHLELVLSDRIVAAKLITQSKKLSAR